jgi:hypothetical protein
MIRVVCILSLSGFGLESSSATGGISAAVQEANQQYMLFLYISGASFSACSYTGGRNSTREVLLYSSPILYPEGNCDKIPLKHAEVLIATARGKMVGHRKMAIY